MGTAPPASTRRPSLGLAAHPPGLKSLFFTELWERFSYYGMRALLTLFMVAAIADGGLGFTAEEAGRVYGNYGMAVYMLAIPGGFLADRVLGARRAVLIGGWTIAAGHYLLAVPQMWSFYTGLVFVALGTGLFKPNISALVGALYTNDEDRRDSGFALFYMGINIGAFIAPLITGFLAQSAMFKGWLAGAGFDPAHSWHWGFAAAGIGMTVAMLIFARSSRDLPQTADPTLAAADGGFSASFVREGLAIIAGTLLLLGLGLLSDMDGFKWLRWMYLVLPLAGIAYAVHVGTPDAQRLAAIGVLFIAAMIFWAIFEQQGSTISLFADQLTRTDVAGVTFPSSWFQSVNPIFVILLTPLFAALWLQLAARQPAPAIKFAIGLALLSASFLLMVPTATLAASGRVSPLWLVGVLFLQTVGELLISPVGLAAMTRLAPVRTTGLVLGLWFLANAFGHKLAGIMGGTFSSTETGALSQSFLVQAALVALAALLLFAAAPWVRRLSSTPR